MLCNAGPQPDRGRHWPGILLTMIHRLLVALVILASTAASRAAEGPLEAEIRTILQDEGIVGAAVVIVEGPGAPLVIHHGSADRSTGRPVGPDTLFRIGSISKNLTSLMATRLASRGALDLEAPVPPDFAIANRFASETPIRLVHLLEHTAAIEGSSYAEYGTNLPNASVEDYVKLRQGQLYARWRPGNFFSYANAGHTLAAAMIERVSGADFDTLMANEVFGPLGMASASFRLDPVTRGRLSKSYANGAESGIWELPNRPAGAALATSADMARLVQFYASDGLRSDGARVLEAEWVQRMRAPASTLAARQAPISGAYGLGTFGFAIDGRLWYGHWGKIDGFLANMGILPGTGRGFAILSNTSNGAAMGQLRSAIAAHLARDLPRPSPRPPVRVPLQAYEGHYQAFTHDMPMRSWIWETLGLVRIEVRDGGLQMRPHFPLGAKDFLIPVDARRFRVESLAVPTAAFVEDPDGQYLVGAAEEALRRIPAWQGWTHAVLAASALAFALVAPLVAAAAGIRRLRGHRADAWPAVRALGLAGLLLLLLIGLFATVGLFGVMDSAGMLGRVSVPSVALLLLSIAFPLALLASLRHLARSWAGTGWGTRLYGALAAISLLSAAAYLGINGWVPLLSWR